MVTFVSCNLYKFPSSSCHRGLLTSRMSSYQATARMIHGDQSNPERQDKSFIAPTRTGVHLPENRSTAGSSDV